MHPRAINMHGAHWKTTTPLLVIAAMLTSTASGMAQPSPAQVAEMPMTLSLGDLYREVQRTNPRIQAARALGRAAQARVPGASRPPDPQFQLGLMNYALPRLAPMPVLGMNQLQLMQMLPLGGKLALAGRAASASANATGYRADDVSWDLRTQAAMAFYDLHSTDRGLDVARETLRLLRDIAATASAMYRVGEGRQTDVLRAQVEIARMVEDTLRMQAMREAMTARIDALLDRAPSAAMGTLILPAFPDSVPTRAWLDSVARETRPMIRAGLEDVRAADASARLARKEIVPDILVGVQYAQQGGEMGTERMGSLMLGASLPIFARSRQLQMRVESDAMKQMAQADLAAMRAETRGKIGEAYAALTRARSLARLYRTTVLPQAEATVASALSAYRVGSVDFMTLLDGRMTVNKYRQELNVLDAEQGKAWAELEMLVGVTLIDASRRSGSIAAPLTSTVGGPR
ncbi:MAG: outer rane efflux protein [Gemmatimonadetes bacterium]|nr:outer rane efflux protein [Gemmatimonadota bacterium]